MERGNVLVIGNSGVGKSTLINSVLGDNCAVAGFGTSGTTSRLEIYESNEIPFRIIDTIGFEPSWVKEMKAIHAVRKWSKASSKTGQEDTQINVIWFCVDGTSRKLFPKAIKDLSHATSMWPSVPVIVVITKSYAIPERSENIEMVHNAFAQQKRYSKNLKAVIPVVAQTYLLNDTAYAPPEGITELIDATNALLPEGLQAAQADIANFKLNRKRMLAHGIVGTATASAVVVGAVPISFPDALILSPIEVGELNALAYIYGIKNDDAAKKFLNTIIDVGTVGAAAKAAISALKAIPGINLGISVLNAIIAGSIVAALGEGSIYAFEQVYLGKKSAEDIDWVRKVIESKLSGKFIEKVTDILQQIADNTDLQTIAKEIAKAFSGK